MNTPLIYCRETAELKFSSWDLSSCLSFLFHMEDDERDHIEFQSNQAPMRFRDAHWYFFFFLTAPKDLKIKNYKSLAAVV